MRMFWSKLCKSTRNCAWNLAFPVFISPIVWNMCENLPYESVYFKELHNEQECYWPTICRAGAAVVSTITSVNCEQSLFFFRFSKGSARARAAKPRDARNALKSRAWSFACLARFARRTKKKERLLLVKALWEILQPRPQLPAIFLIMPCASVIIQ